MPDGTDLKEAKRTFYALEGNDRIDFQATLFREYEKKVDELNVEIEALKARMGEMEKSTLRALLVTIKDVFGND